MRGYRLSGLEAKAMVKGRRYRKSETIQQFEPSGLTEKGLPYCTATGKPVTSESGNAGAGGNQIVYMTRHKISKRYFIERGRVAKPGDCDKSVNANIDERLFPGCDVIGAWVAPKDVAIEYHSSYHGGIKITMHPGESDKVRALLEKERQKAELKAKFDAGLLMAQGFNPLYLRHRP